MIEALAKQRKTKLAVMSLGQGQEGAAQRCVAHGAAEGHWVLLQNVHLNPDFLVQLERTLRGDGLAPHADFRLWLTASPHPHFPIGLLHLCLRLTNEPPSGLKAGMAGFLSWVSQDQLEAINRPDWCQLLYITAFLHCLLQGRRRYGAIGWAAPYAFDQADLAAAVHVLQAQMSEAESKRAPGPNWEALRYLVGAVQYGGRVTEAMDRRLLETIVAHFYAPARLLRGASLAALGAGGIGALTVPDRADLDAFQRAVGALPDVETPELFGLHASADTASRTSQVCVCEA